MDQHFWQVRCVIFSIIGRGDALAHCLGVVTCLHGKCIDHDIDDRSICQHVACCSDCRTQAGGNSGDIVRSVVYCSLALSIHHQALPPRSSIIFLHHTIQCLIGPMAVSQSTLNTFGIPGVGRQPLGRAGTQPTPDMMDIPTHGDTASGSQCSNSPATWMNMHQ